MEPTDKPSVSRAGKLAQEPDQTHIDFLPDADEIERSPLPFMARTTLYVLLGTLLSFVVWASVFEIDRVVVARGRLVTPLPNVVVQPLETSIVQSIEVRLGQIVRHGERLATLDPTFAEADAAQLETRLHSLDTQVARLEGELNGKSGKNGSSQDADGRLQAKLTEEREANYRAQKTQIEESIARMKAALATNREDQQLLAARLMQVKELETMQENLLKKNYVSRALFLETQGRRLDAERDMQLARHKEQELLRETAAAEAELAAFAKGWRQKTMEELLTTMRERDAINEQLQKAEMRHKLVTLTAPVDAVVLDIAKLSQGSIAREAEPLFTLVPLNEELVAEVQIESADVGYVKQGDPVHIKVDAYPFQRHGTLDATVTTISADAFRRENDATGTSGYYLSRIALGAAKLKKMPERSTLLPGMTLTAEIVVGKRSVMSYLLWPLTKAMDESIREP
jgi:HlyD family secretion protein